MKARQVLLAALLGVAVPMQAAAQDKRFDGATGWLNPSQASTPELRGKVVLVDFWTYTCINWLRTLPYVRAWADKYRDQGLVVVGVHTPEFQFERNIDNVTRSAREMRVTWPVALDNNYSVWRAFANDAWPAVYLVDAKGKVRYRHLGEGKYEETERMIQQLLAENGAAGVPRELASPDSHGLEVAADWANLKSPETYLGNDKADSRVHTAAAHLRLNQWATSGTWTAKGDAVVLQKANGRIAYRFHARDVNMVMGPARPGSAVRFRVLLDGKPPAAVRGTDTDAQGNGTVSEQRLYQLIRQPSPIGDRQFEIEFLDPGVEAYAFTFG